MARGVFGDLFDYDRDGELDPAEQSFEFAFMEQQEKEALLDDYRDNQLGLDPDDFDSPEEFLEAYEEKDAWVDAIDIDESILADELFIDPADYDSYEEFHDALVEAQELNEEAEEDIDAVDLDFCEHSADDLILGEAPSEEPGSEDNSAAEETPEPAVASLKYVVPDEPLSPSSWQDAFSVGALYQGILYRERDEVSVRSFPLKGYSALIRVGTEPAYDVHLILHGPQVHSMQCRCWAAQRNKLCEHMAAAMFAYSGNARIRVTTPDEKAFLRATFPDFGKEAERHILTPDPLPDPIAEPAEESAPVSAPISSPVPDDVPEPVPAETVPTYEADIPAEEPILATGIEITNKDWERLPPEEKKRALYERQKTMLAEFLERGAISQAEYDKSLHDMTVKMGYEEDIPDEAVVFDPGIEIKEPKHRSLAKWIVALVILAGVVTALVMYARQMRMVHVQQCYTSAELYIAAGEYQLAIDELDAIKNTYHIDTFLDSAPLRDLCEAHIELSAGDSQEAFDLLKNKQPFEYQSADFIRDYNDFVHKVEDAHNQDLAEQRQKELEQKRKEAARKVEFREELKHKLPYEGLSEEYIDSTVLGYHDSLYEDESWSHTKINRYTFYLRDGSYYRVTCKEGEVIGVDKYRAPSSSSTSKSSSTKTSDPYDVYDYSDPDDFYYDHYDDFWDYEDAEDYYYDHVR